MNAIVRSILTRVAHNKNITLHHLIFEGSHPHLIVTAKDANHCQEFYSQLQKQLTDSIKRLLGIQYLNIWEGRASIIEIPTVEDAIDKISYVYANPSNDGLVSTIERYPGVSTWADFNSAKDLESCAYWNEPWIRLPMIPRLPTRSVSLKLDKRICEEMLEKVKVSHTLKIYPNKWIEHFLKSPTPKQVEAINQQILSQLLAREAENSRIRKLEGKKPMGVTKLLAQPLLKSHTPKKHGIKIQVQTKFKEIRIALIEEFKLISNACRKAYQHWRRGDFSIPWPPGTFPPPLPPLANALR